MDTFVKAMLANPTDPGPRLTYADWLMEHGSEADYHLGERIKKVWARPFIPCKGTPAEPEFTVHSFLGLVGRINCEVHGVDSDELFGHLNQYVNLTYDKGIILDVIFKSARSSITRRGYLCDFIMDAPFGWGEPLVNRGLIVRAG